MTAVKDPWIERPTWDAYVELLREGKLTERVCVLWSAGNTLDSARKALAEIQAQPRPPQSLGDGRLLSCGAKIFMDGSGGARTAWMYKDWNKDSTGVDAGNSGYPALDPEVYRQQVRLFHDAGVHVGTHAIGDRAIDWVVDTYAQVLAEKPTRGLRHSIIHANIPTDHAIATMALLQSKYDAGYPEAQAPFTWWIGDTYAGNFGPERSQRLMPLKTYLDKGIIWGGGSDYPVTPLPARYGLWASVEREALKGTFGPHPFGTAEAVDIHAALRSYTLWAARQLFLDDSHGVAGGGQGRGYCRMGQESLRHAVAASFAICTVRSRCCPARSYSTRMTAKEQSMAKISKRPVTRAAAESAVQTLLRWAGEDPQREGLRDTPKRVVDAYRDWFSGYASDPRAYLGARSRKSRGTTRWSCCATSLSSPSASTTWRPSSAALTSATCPGSVWSASASWRGWSMASRAASRCRRSSPRRSRPASTRC